MDLMIIGAISVACLAVAFFGLLGLFFGNNGRL